MTDYFLWVLTFTQVPVFFVLATRIMCRLNSHVAFKKNPDWISSHPEFMSYRIYEKIAAGASYLLAILSLAALVQYTMINPMPEYLIELHIAPLFVWTAGSVIYFLAFFIGVTKKIPIPDKRIASTADRQLSSYVPMWVAYVGYAGLLAVIIVYLWAFLSNALTTEIALARLGGLGFIVIVGTILLLMALRRKHVETELILGSVGRKVEVKMCFAVLYLGIFAGGYRILDDFYGILLFGETSFFVAIGFALQIWVIAASFLPSVRSLLRSYS